MEKKSRSIAKTDRRSKLRAIACIIIAAVTALLSGYAFAASSGGARYIGATDAKYIALTDAGITESQISSIKIEFDQP